jgi:hypothetical protein
MPWLASFQESITIDVYALRSRSRRCRRRSARLTARAARSASSTVLKSVPIKALYCARDHRPSRRKVSQYQPLFRARYRLFLMVVPVGPSIFFPSTFMHEGVQKDRNPEFARDQEDYVGVVSGRDQESWHRPPVAQDKNAGRIQVRAHL